MNRDSIVEEALKHELRAMNTPAGPACVDSETLAAWQDNGLDAPAMASVEAHLSSCARCQALVALAMKAAPTTPATESRSGFTWWKWAAPLAAGAAAVTLWMIVPEQQDITMAPAQPSVVAPADAVPPQERQPASAAPAVTAQPSAPPVTRENRAPVRDSAAQEKQQRPAAAAETVAPPTIAETTAALPPAPAPAPAMQRSARFAAPIVEVVSPVATQRWRASAGGIERSQDDGATWTLVRPPQGESITGGTAPSPTVCWLFGQAGMVLLTTDGTTFTRVDVPDTSDVVAITAVDGQSATATMSSGRTFRTSDGGRSWQ